MDEIAKLKTQVSSPFGSRVYLIHYLSVSKGNGFRKYYLTERQRATLLETGS